MPNFTDFQYQAHTEPVFTGGENNTEDKWHQGWSEPVRQKIKPALAIALMASGLFFFPVQDAERVSEDKWHRPWSEPVRVKPRLQSGLQPVLAFHTNPIVSFGWYRDLGYPTSLMRKRMEFRVALQRATTMEAPTQPPANQLIQWFGNLSEPVRIKPGLKVALQRAFEGPDRLLPTPDVTVTIAATEINSDIALFAVNVYDGSGTITSGQGARVSIVEVPAAGGDPWSIRES